MDSGLGRCSCLRTGHQARISLDELDTDSRETSTIELGDSALGRLRDLGELGGRVTAIGEAEATVEVPLS